MGSLVMSQNKNGISSCFSNQNSSQIFFYWIASQCSLWVKLQFPTQAVSILVALLNPATVERMARKMVVGTILAWKCSTYRFYVHRIQGQISYRPIYCQVQRSCMFLKSMAFSAKTCLLKYDFVGKPNLLRLLEDFPPKTRSTQSTSFLNMQGSPLTTDNSGPYSHGICTEWW